MKKLLLIICFLIFAAYSEKQETKQNPADTTGKPASSPAGVVNSSEDTATTAGTNNHPLKQEFPDAGKEKVLAASKKILKWVKSDDFDKALTSQVKEPRQLNEFLGRNLDSIVTLTGFVNRAHYVQTESKYGNDPQVGKLAQEIQSEFDKKLMPVVKPEKLSPADAKQREKLITCLNKAIELIQGVKFRNQINSGLEQGINDQAYYDKINNSMLMEAGFDSMQEALKLIKKFNYDPEVQKLAIELRQLSNQIIEKKQPPLKN